VARYSSGDDARKKARSNETRACGAFTITRRRCRRVTRTGADDESRRLASKHIDPCYRAHVLRHARDAGSRKTDEHAAFDLIVPKPLMEVDFERNGSQRRSRSARRAAAARPRSVSRKSCSSSTPSTQPRPTDFPRGQSSGHTFFAPLRRDDEIAQSLRARAGGNIQSRMAPDGAKRQTRKIVRVQGPGDVLLAHRRLIRREASHPCAARRSVSRCRR